MNNQTVNFNFAQFTGRIIRKQELAILNDDRKVLTVTLTVRSKAYDAEGEVYRRTDFPQVVFYGEDAAVVDSLPLESTVSIDARFQTRSYTDKKGMERYVSEFVALSLNEYLMADPNAWKRA